MQMDRVGSGTAIGQRQSHISSQMVRLSNGVKQMEEAVSCIEARLEGVVRSEPASPETQTQEKPPSMVRFAEDLGQIAYSIESMTRRVSQLTGRIEL